MIYFVIPSFEDAGPLETLLELIAKLDGADQFFMVLVDDGSMIKPLEKNCLEKTRLDGAIISKKRNSGAESSIALGLYFANQTMTENDKLVIMDADGEDDPSGVKFLLENCSQTEVAVASRGRRTNALWWRCLYVVYKSLFKLASGVNLNFGHFMALNKTAVERLVWMPETQIHVGASLVATKIPIRRVPTDREFRLSGKSSNVSVAVVHIILGLNVFIERFFVRISVASVAIFLLLFVASLSVLCLRFLEISVPGFATIVLAIIMLCGIQIISVNISTMLILANRKVNSVMDEKHYDDMIHSLVVRRRAN